MGITDEQASDMARNLEFEGPALQEVRKMSVPLCVCVCDVISLSLSFSEGCRSDKVTVQALLWGRCHSGRDQPSGRDTGGER